MPEVFYQQLRRQRRRAALSVTAFVLTLCLLPLALIFSENSMTNLQTVSIIAAFPVGIIMLIIITSFFKDADAYLKEQEQNTKS